MSKKRKIATSIILGLLIVISCSTATTNAQLQTITKISVNHQEQTTQSATVTAGDNVNINPLLINQFDAEWVNWEITYNINQGANIMGEIVTSAPSSFMNRKGEMAGFELHFQPNASGTVQVDFYYNGTYQETFPTSEQIPYSSVYPFSQVTIEVQDKSFYQIITEAPQNIFLAIIISIAIIIGCSWLIYRDNQRKKHNNKNYSYPPPPPAYKAVEANLEKQNSVLIREKLAEARHNETISEIGAFIGLVFIALAAFATAIWFLLFAGLALIFSGILLPLRLIDALQ